MIKKISIVLFIVFQSLLNGYLLFDYNSFVQRFTDTNVEVLRIKAQLRDYETRLENTELEKRLVGERIPGDYLKKYTNGTHTLVVLATSQDCSPCTESELKVWQSFMKENKRDINMLCIYYKYYANQYGKYENIYKSIFPFVYDDEKLVEKLELDDTPVVLLVDAKGKIVIAHRPDVMNVDKTEQFIKKALKLI